MKYITLLLLSFNFCVVAKAVEYGYLTTVEREESTALTLGEGDVCRILAFNDTGYTNSNTGKTELRLYLPGDTSEFIRFNGYNIDGVHTQTNTESGVGGGVESRRIFVGPCTIKLYSASGRAYMSFEITKASEVQYKQANIISLPGESVGAGTHEIVVEASDDLQTWTPVHSSSIGGDKAFFRTRVVVKEP